MNEADEYLHYAELSAAAYHPGTAEEAVGHRGFVVDRELSNRNRTTFFHPASKKAVVAFRGTNPWNPSDLYADWLLARGHSGTSSRFKTSAAVVRKANRKYGLDNVHVTGHSLGGAQALDVNRRLGNKAFAFNPGAGLGDLTRDILMSAFTNPARRKKSTATIISTPGDVIGAAGMFGNDRRVFVKPKVKSLHSIKNFL